MKKTGFILIVLLALAGTAFLFMQKGFGRSLSYSQLEEPFEDQVLSVFESDYDRMARELRDWKRPEGPFRVALQAGHWKANEAPDEFPNLRTNTGTSGGGKTEWQVNLEIAEKTKAILEAQGILVEILPATVPEDYLADLFISIHADGNADSGISGYKAASPRRDLTAKAADFVKVLEAEYARATGLSYDPNVTRNMRGYYAFNWRRYDHAIHPMTPGVILETGFLTNPSDRQIIVSGQEKAAQGIASAILNFKRTHGL